MTKTMKTLRALLYYIPVSVCFALLVLGGLVFALTGWSRVDVTGLLFVMSVAWGVFAVAMRPREV